MRPIGTMEEIRRMNRRAEARLLRVSVVLGLCLGMALLPAAFASVSGYPQCISGTIYQDDFVEFASFEFAGSYQVYFELTYAVYDGSDLDLLVLDPNYEIVCVLGTGGYGDSLLAEKGFFLVPETGMYHVFISGYYVANPDGIEVELCVDYGTDLVEIPPLEPNGIKWGQLVSYVRNSANARYHASANAAFNRAGEVVETAGSLYTRNGFVNWLHSMYYQLPLLRFCPDDVIGLGGLAWMLPAEYIDRATAEFLFSYYRYVHYIDGVPLAEFTDVYDPPMDVVTNRGVTLYYVKMQETAIFKAGELLEMLGPGRHTLTSTIPALGASMDSYFWILPEGTTLPPEF
jgi:hypothetical protein